MKTSRKNNSVTGYYIFLATILIVIIGNAFILKSSLDKQEADAELINRSGKQRMLSQRITKTALYLNLGDTSENTFYNRETLLASINEFVSAEAMLVEQNKELDHSGINILFEKIKPEFNTIVTAGKEIQNNYKNEEAAAAIVALINAEQAFLTKMNTIVFEYQKQAEDKIATAKTTIFILFFISGVILLGQWFFIVWPLFKQLHNQNQSLSFSNQQLTDFAHITSHNLRAPVANLNLLMDIHTTAKTQNEKNIIIEKIQTVIGHLSTTLNILIDSLKIRETRNIQKETMKLNDVLETTKELLSGKIIQNDVKITSDFSEVSELNFNKIYLDSIFLNLIGNAIKYRKPDISPEIHLKSKKMGEGVSLTISDNGLGINLNRHGDKIFGLSKTFHAHPEAKGVGLFMTKTQIESQGGTISVKSEEGVGSEFKMTFKN